MSDAKRSFLQRVSEWGPVQLVSSKIRYKLLVGLLATALVPLIGLGVAVNRSSEKALMSQAYSQLESVRTIKQHQVESYFKDLHNLVGTFADNRMTREAMHEFKTTFESARDEAKTTPEQLAKMKSELRSYYSNEFATEYKKKNGDKLPPIDEQLAKLDEDSIFLQYQFIKANPNPLGSKDLLDSATVKTSYNDAHERFHPVVRNMLKKFGLYDVFLVDVESGDIVYTVFKELDFSTNLKTGLYAKSNIGRAFELAAKADSTDAVVMVDYEGYLPSYDDAASFVAAPIFEEGKKIGVAIFQIPIAKIDEIMAERTGLGETGETYAVGSDKLFRNNSRFAKDLGVASTILNKTLVVETEAANGGLEGKSGSKIIKDYRNSPVLSSWAPIAVHKPAVSGDQALTWSLISEIDLAEVQTPVNSMLWTTVGIVLSATVIVVLASMWFAKKFTTQADAITGMLSQIGIGIFDARAEVVSNDELGLVAISLNAMCDNTLSLIQSREERDQIEGSIAQLKEEMNKISGGDLTVETEVAENITGGLAASVNSMVEQLRQIVANVQDTTLKVASSAHQIQDTTEHLSAGSETQSAQIIDTSAAVDEMAVSIQQVAENTATSETVANKARQSAQKGAAAVHDTIRGMDRIRDQVQDSSKRIKRLGETSQEIGEIVQLIGDIADRTSILALNASIQAAMAGEAGQGFAVVAEEVERLAERCNNATKQIAGLIKAIQNDTSEAITAMEESTKEVVDGSKLATQAGTALDEIEQVSNQLAELIHSISLATKQQARGAEAVSKSMSDISQITQQTSAGTRQAAVSVNSLATLAQNLSASVSTFKLPGRTQGANHLSSFERSVESTYANASAALAEEFAR